MDCHIIPCLEQTISSLNKTFTSSSNSHEIKEAEDRLRRLAREFPKFIEVLQIIILSESHPGFDNNKKAKKIIKKSFVFVHLNIFINII